MISVKFSSTRNAGVSLNRKELLELLDIEIYQKEFQADKDAPREHIDFNKCTEEDIQRYLAHASGAQRPTLEAKLDGTQQCIEDPTSINLGLVDGFENKALYITGSWCSKIECPEL